MWFAAQSLALRSSSLMISSDELSISLLMFLAMTDLLDLSCGDVIGVIPAWRSTLITSTEHKLSASRAPHDSVTIWTLERMDISESELWAKHSI